MHLHQNTFNPSFSEVSTFAHSSPGSPPFHRPAGLSSSPRGMRPIDGCSQSVSLKQDSSLRGAPHTGDPAIDWHVDNKHFPQPPPSALSPFWSSHVSCNADTPAERGFPFSKSSAPLHHYSVPVSSLPCSEVGQSYSTDDDVHKPTELVPTNFSPIG